MTPLFILAIIVWGADEAATWVAIIDFLRRAMVLVWTIVLLVSLRGSTAVITGRGVRHGDAMRFACFLASIPFVFGNLWWLTGAVEPFLFAIVLAVGVGGGIYAVVAMWGYGRGSLRA